MVRQKIQIISILALLLVISSCGSTRKIAKDVEGARIDKVITTARSYLGTPYRWGGATKAGIDCSGLLYNSFRAAGLDLPRTSQEQGKIGKKINIYEVQPGDLVFFAANKRGSKVSHVGLVTEIKGRREVMFIHSSSSRGVIENNIFSDYYHSVFIKARRPF